MFAGKSSFHTGSKSFEITSMLFAGEQAFEEACARRVSLSGSETELRQQLPAGSDAEGDVCEQAKTKPQAQQHVRPPTVVASSASDGGQNSDQHNHSPSQRRQNQYAGDAGAGGAVW